MSTRKPSPRARALRPRPEDLETRQMLSTVLRGIDIDGDTWSLRMQGPGDVRVVNQSGLDQEPIPLGTPAQIDQITVGGTNAQLSTLVGRVQRGANGDGRVYFKRLEALANQSPQDASGNGLQAVDMPGFWLGNTSPAGTTAPGSPPASIAIPNGVSSLRLGGVDASRGTTPGVAPASAQDDSIPIALGLPRMGGTRIIVDQVISSTQPRAATGDEPAEVVQHGVFFNVSGRLSLFQADAILGDPDNPGGQFPGGGGTVVASLPDQNSGITGQIGDVRIGGDATNFSTLTNDRLANYYIGGETRNVSLLTPTGSRNLHFGKGLDTVTINTHSIEHLEANRGAQSSSITADRGLGRLRFGGDVANSTFLSGYPQNLAEALTNQSVTANPSAQSGGYMNVLVAGDVTDTVFAASVEPFEGVFGTPNDLVLPQGQITAKVEGLIDNSVATPQAPGTAFYAQSVDLVTGPVTPPDVPELPFPGPKQPLHLPGIGALDRSQSAGQRTAGQARGTPRGPRSNR